MCKLTNKYQKGFNLTELLVVVGIIGILTSVSFVSVKHHLSVSKLTATEAFLENLATAVTSFKVDTGRYPAAGRLYLELTDRQAAASTKWNGPYFDFEEKYRNIIFSPSNADGAPTNVDGSPLPPSGKNAFAGENICDLWGTRIIYIPERDYVTYGVHNESSFAGEITTVTVYQNPRSFVLISAGPNRKIAAGSDDHYTPWPWHNQKDDNNNSIVDDFRKKGGVEPEDDIVTY
jgi:prepilin-type N-terminal cleavage/methylation domain-containing protein